MGLGVALSSGCAVPHQPCSLQLAQGQAVPPPTLPEPGVLRVCPGMLCSSPCQDLPCWAWQGPVSISLLLLLPCSGSGNVQRTLSAFPYLSLSLLHF